MQEKVAILDCGGQYTKVIDRRVREAGVYSDILPIGADISKLTNYSAFILSGGPSSVWANGAPSFDPSIFSLGKPILGICYGMQLITEYFGGEVASSFKTEYGTVNIKCDTECPLFDSLDSTQTVLMSHGDAVKVVPEGFRIVAKTGDVTAGLWSESMKIVGVQFHPEVDLTENGVKMLDNFLRKICGLKEEYKLDDRIKTSVEMIRKKVGDNNVIALVSGGVDSAVTAALLLKALPSDHVYAIHIDHGMMRLNESDEICSQLKKQGLKNLTRINAEDEFFYGKVDAGDGKLIGPLSEACDPELKRKIIGSMFLKVTKEAAEKLDLDYDHTFLAQGTLRPDLIESGNPDVSGYAHKIKTHHNDVELVRRAREKGLIVETNWDWHKDEVRRVARMLGLSEAIASRQPFPGPGLGVRILCSDGVADDVEDIQKRTDALLDEMHDDLPVEAEIAPIKSVGVQGDNRSYKNLAVLFSKEPVENIFTSSKLIPNKIPEVNRCLLAMNAHDRKKFVLNSLHISHETADILRIADDIVTKQIINGKISQCFAVLLPFSTEKGKYCIGIRAVVTNDFMTARAAEPGRDFPKDALSNIVKEITDKLGDKIDLIFYDVTGKPPATVEFE